MFDLLLSKRIHSQITSDRYEVDLQESDGDIDVVSSWDNLKQAILNRLFTRKGELSDLGHPFYGSRLYLLIGEPNNKRTHALAGLYIRESLAYETRIREIQSIRFIPVTAQSTRRNFLEGTVVVVPTEEENEPISLSLRMNLEG